jgi:hypothetical protein
MGEGGQEDGGKGEGRNGRRGRGAAVSQTGGFDITSSKLGFRRQLVTGIWLFLMNRQADEK